MNLIDRYLAKTILASIGLITLMLAGLQLFILFVNQLAEIGRGDYHVMHAAFFVLLQIPYQVYLFFPVASLLGALLGLGILANHSELIVLRAAGLSILQITGSVLKAALIVIFVVTILGETIIPSLSQFGNTVKMRAITGGQALKTPKGLWMRVNQENFLSIGSVLSDDKLEAIYQFRFNPRHELQVVRKIDQLVFSEGSWKAHGVNETWIEKERTVVKHHDTMRWDLTINPLILRVSSRQPDEMSLSSLAHYVYVQRADHQLDRAYELVFWQRLFQPLTTVVMMILAIPFVFGPLRGSTMGSKLVMGAGIGFSFYLANRFLGPFTQVYQWPPILAALGPTFFFALLGVYLLQRVR